MKDNKINVYNKSSQVCINIVNTYLWSNNYNIILYLCLKKGFTYIYELNELVGYNNWSYYLKKLNSLGILREYELDEKEIIYMTHKNTSSIYQVKAAKYYTLTNDAKEEIESDSQKYDKFVSQFSDELYEWILGFLAKVEEYYYYVESKNYLDNESREFLNREERIKNSLETEMREYYGLEEVINNER